MGKIVTNAYEIYKALVDSYGIKSLSGIIKFRLGNISVAVRRKEIIGGVLQEWLEQWLKKYDVDFLSNPLMNMPPDIYLDTKDKTKGWLEIKAFNYDDNPRFSIAYFRTFGDELIAKPWHLDMDYLIFGYVMHDETGLIKVQDIWLKKIWEITKPMSSWPLTVQFKNCVLHEIRPCRWYADKGNIKVFESKEDFLSAFEEALYQNPDTHNAAGLWKNQFRRNYKKHYGKDIRIPHWEEIMKKYGW